MILSVTFPTVFRTSFPECGFSVDITDDQQLLACTHIGSDLVLKDSTITAVTNKIQDVAGCIVIENTNLDSLDFLELNSAKTPKCVGVTESSEFGMVVFIWITVVY